ncbi:MAG TPA: hypothetical protein VFV86_07800 [Nitrososphaeraceae archaeon]|nr:hypothetical protein [Nitrososphaeraceae archaeon]
MISYGLAENRNQLLVYDQFGGKGSNDRPSIHLPIFDIDKKEVYTLPLPGVKKSKNTIKFFLRSAKGSCNRKFET